MKYRIIILLTVVLFIFTGIFGIAKSQEPEKQDVFRVAIFAPLTGPAASGGIATKEGFELALSAMQKSGARLELEYIDTKSDPKVAISAFEQTLALNKTKAVILELSSVTRTIRPLLAGRVFALATAVAAPEIADPANHLIRYFPNSRGVAAVAARAALSHGAKNCAVIHVNDEYGKESAHVFSDAYRAAGGTILATETFGLLERDFRGQAAKLIDANPGCLWVTGYGPGYLTVLNQLREAGYRKTILTDWSITAPDYFSSVKDNEGILVVSPLVSDSLTNAYRSRFQKDGFMVNVAYAYDSLMLLKQAFDASDGTPRGITDAMIAIGTFKGAAGDSVLLPNGDIDASYGLFEVKNNKLIHVSIP
jgi:branched-chain amino acid transport system substrate-binding protein